MDVSGALDSTAARSIREEQFPSRDELVNSVINAVITGVVTALVIRELNL